MRPSEIYALPGVAEHWLEAVHLDVDAMFDRPPSSDWTTYPEGVDALAKSLPLTASVKLRAHDEHDPECEVRWTAWSWKGKPFGVTVTAGGVEERYVTDPDGYGQAHIALVSLHSPLRDHDVFAADADVDMDVVAGVVLVRTHHGIRPLPARILSDGAAPLLDPDRFAEACREVFDPRDRHLGAPGIADGTLAAVARTALLAGASLATRRCASFRDLGALVSSRAVGWVGLLVADASGTYAVGLEPHDVRDPAGCLPDNVRVWSVGGPGLIADLALDAVLDVGEEPAPPTLSPLP